MKKCKLCGAPISNPDSPGRAQWCEAINRLLVLKVVHPEDYHEACFLDAIVSEFEACCTPAYAGNAQETRNAPPRAALHPLLN